MLSPEAAEVVSTFVAAFPNHVRSRLAGSEVPPTLQAAIGAGADWLKAELIQLLSMDFAAQRRGPLELFQEATTFPTEALTNAGVEPPERDRIERSALPGDRFRLAPTSSQDLGEPAWKAHAAWGVAKAAAVAGARPSRPGLGTPRVAVIGGDMSTRASLERITREAGLPTVLWRNPAAIDEGLQAGAPVLAVVDRNHASAEQAISSIAASGGRVVVFGRELNDFDHAAMMALGAEAAVDRAQLEATVTRMLPTLT
jgi:hypothetical protein